MVSVDRRTVLTTAAGVAIGASPHVLSSVTRGLGLAPSPNQIRDRLSLPSGVQSGDVTSSSAVLWSRSSDAGRLAVRLTSNGRTVRSVRGGWADQRTDHTAKLALSGLAPGREYDAALWFTAPDGTRSQEETLTFRTASIHPAATSFVWSGDTCGQSWGINPELGGLIGYRAMLDVRPDLFIHSGDHIYSDEVIEESQVDRDGSVWRNSFVTESMAKPAETLAEYRERHRYPLLDDHVRALNRSVPTVAMWDDHETTNNWWPGGTNIIDGYTERSCDVLAERGRRAFQEYTPIATHDLVDKGRDGFAMNRIYRKIERGAHLDVFCLDMRSYRDANTLGTEKYERSMLGTPQTDWLIREVTRSRATWKVISADLPLSVVGPALDTGLYDSYANADAGAPLGRELELARILSAFKANGVQNVIWITADVHYTAAHHYDPARARFTEFEPFWEFISGPISASTFNVKPLDPTFGPDVVFAKGNDGTSQGPRFGNQFFGHVEISSDGVMTVNLRDIGGRVLWSKDLEPARI